MHVVHVTAFLAPHLGGVENYVANLAAAQAAAGNQVTILVPDTERVRADPPPPPPGVQVERFPVRARYFKLVVAPALWRRLRRLAAGGDDVVIHVHAPFPTGLEAAIRCGRRTATPVVATYHGEGVSFARPWYAWPRRAYSRLEKRGLVGAVRVVFLSASYRDSLRLPGALAASPVIPTGVDVDRFTPDGPAAPLAGKTPVLYVGSLIEANRYKGVDVLVQAAADVPGVHVHVVGRGPLVTSLSALAADLKIAARVTFHDDVDDDALPSYYRGAAAFVLPSTRGPENGPLVVTEAMASGTPTIVTDIPGVVASVGDGAWGTIVARNDTAALAAALGRVADRDPALQDTAARALAAMRATRTWRDVAAAYRDVYAGAALTR